MSIESVPIRATIKFGGITVKTPYILSFSVLKTRNTKTTFNARLKILSHNLSNISRNEITISAGKLNNERLIFTGYILTAKPSPCFDDPNYTILMLSGADILYRLDGEKYTRRQIDHKSRWAIIEGVQRKSPKSSRFQLVNKPIDVTSDDAKNDNEKDSTTDYTSMNKISRSTTNVSVNPVVLRVSSAKLVDGGQ